MIAFLIAAHTEPRHVARLVARLSPHKIFIHVDKKTLLDEHWHSIDADFVEERVAVYWGDFSQVEASLALIEAALATGEHYDKLVLISGVCYPIRPIGDLEQYFALNPSFNHIGRIPVDVSPELRRMTEFRFHMGGFVPWSWNAHYLWARNLDRSLRRLYALTFGRFRRPWRGGATRFHGSQWWAITTDCARYILERSKTDTALVNAYRYSFAPDEQFFHSMVADSPFREASGPDHPFIAVGAHVAANLHMLDPALQKWYSVRDIDEIEQSDKFFVRKVDTSHSASLLDYLDARCRDHGTAS